MCVEFISGPQVLTRKRIVFKVVRKYAGRLLSLYSPSERIPQVGGDGGTIVEYKLGETQASILGNTYGFYTYPSLLSVRYNARRFLRMEQGAFQTKFVCLVCVIPKDSHVIWGTTCYIKGRPYDRRYATLNAERITPIKKLPDFNYTFVWGALKD